MHTLLHVQKWFLNLRLSDGYFVITTYIILLFWDNPVNKRYSRYLNLFQILYLCLSASVLCVIVIAWCIWNIHVMHVNTVLAVYHYHDTSHFTKSLYRSLVAPIHTCVLSKQIYVCLNILLLILAHLPQFVLKNTGMCLVSLIQSLIIYKAF